LPGTSGPIEDDAGIPETGAAEGTKPMGTGTPKAAMEKSSTYSNKPWWLHLNMHGPSEVDTYDVTVGAYLRMR
jgi:hypothetical protein